MLKLTSISALFFVVCLSWVTSNPLQAQVPRYLESEPGASVFPRAKQPAEVLRVFDARALPKQTQSMVASIQGLVNRETPELYLLLSRNRIRPLDGDSQQGRRQSIDQVWLDWLQQHQYCRVADSIETLNSLLETYQIRDVVVVDPELPAALNIATMVSAVRGIPLAYPEDVERFDLNPVEDLRGRWKTNIEAYQWAWEELWPQLNPRAIAVLSPEIGGHLRDYLVQQRVFTFWISHADYQDDYTSDQDLPIFKKMLEQMPVNIPVVGYPNHGGVDTGIGEGLGVKLLTDYGKFLVPTDWHTNLSVWTGWNPRTTLKQPEVVEPTFDPTQRYLTILVSDGDNMNLWLDFMPSHRYWRSPQRGKFPVAWTMGPAMLELHAPLLDYYYPSMTANDSFGCAVSGLGYMYPQHYGSAFGEHHDEILKRYLQMTNRFVQKLDMNWYWGTIVGERDDGNFQQVARELKGMEVIFEGYGRQWWRDAPYLSAGVPVMHFLNNAVNEEETRRQVLRRLERDQPQFGVVFIQNWPFDMDEIRQLMEACGPEYQWVGPAQLGRLYRQSLSQKSRP